MRTAVADRIAIGDAELRNVPVLIFADSQPPWNEKAQTEREVVTVPELRLHVGGFNGVLQPVNIFSKPVGNDLQHGNLGMDVLSQPSEVTIDFEAMSLVAR